MIVIKFYKHNIKTIQLCAHDIYSIQITISKKRKVNLFIILKIQYKLLY